MPVSTTSFYHFRPGGTPAGNPPGPPTGVTSTTKDAGAVVSFYAPGYSGDSSITSYTVTPYIGGTAQATTTVAAGSVGSVTTSSGTTARQITVTGLTNSTAYTFTVHATNTYGNSTESSASGTNTPLSGLVFGDDFNGPADGPIDPEWWVMNRCGFLSQSEVEYWLPSQVRLDGTSGLQLIADHTSYTGPRYPSDPSYPGSITQPWRSGAVQSNTKTWLPSTGNTMTFEVRQQVCPDAGGAMWPGFTWLAGQAYLNLWKTDPVQTAWDTASHAEIDFAEWYGGGLQSYRTNTWGESSDQWSVNTSTDFSAAMHTFAVRWKPGVSTTFIQDGSQTHQATGSSIVAGTGCQFIILIYLQIVAGTAASPQHCTVDYVRVYDQNLG